MNHAAALIPNDSGRVLIAGGSNAPINAFDGQEFPTVPLYSGNPWFLPMVGAWYRTRDWWDRVTA